MKVTLGSQVEFELFQTEDVSIVEELAKEIGAEVYSWKTEEFYNWLEKGYSIVDTLGLVILEKDLPSQIPLPDDM